MIPAADDTPSETPEAHRRSLATAFDSIIASNLKLAASVDGLVEVVNKQVKFSAVVVGLVAVLFAIAMLKR